MVTAGKQTALRAALAVSALSVEERRWMEQRLAPAERRKLDAALAEIEGKPLGELAERLGGMAVPAEDGEQDSHWLARHLPQLILAVHAEPPWMWPVIGTVLGADLRRQVLDTMAGMAAVADKADAVRRYWQSCAEPVGPELRRTVLRQLVLAASTYPQPAPAVGPAGAKRGWLAKLLEKWHG